MMKFLIGFYFLIFSKFAFSCSCSAPDIIERIESADKVIIGIVVSVHDLEYFPEAKNNDTSGLKAKVVVKEVLKGKSNNEIFLYSNYGRGDCGLGFRVADEYIFFLKDSKYVNGCQGHITDMGFGLGRYESKLKEVKRLIDSGI